MTQNTLISIEDQAGTKLKEDASLDDVIERAGFDFEVEKVPAFSPEGTELDGLFVLRRTDTKDTMNIVRGRYQPIHNREMFAPFDTVVKEYNATYENAGLVRGGRTCWITAKLPDTISINGEDNIEQRIIGMAHHDGMRRNSYFQFSKRVWCNNMLRVLQDAAKSGTSIGHTTKWQDHLEKARTAFTKAINAGLRFGSQAQSLADRKLSGNQADCFLQNLYPLEKEASQHTVTRTNNRRENVLELFRDGVGNSGQTRWDMLNAITEYYDHHVGNKRTNAASKFMSNMTGMGNDKVKQLAFNLLVEHDKFAALDPQRN
jgi:phage/plasmid-like protein (TIGR03299 family)